MSADPILQVDQLIHAPVRLAIMSVLISVESATFKYLKEATSTTDGNLNTHLAKLEDAGYISVEKSFVGKKPQTTCALTKQGRAAFEHYLAQIEQFVNAQKRD